MKTYLKNQTSLDFIPNWNQILPKALPIIDAIPYGVRTRSPGEKPIVVNNDDFVDTNIGFPEINTFLC